MALDDMKASQGLGRASVLAEEGLRWFAAATLPRLEAVAEINLANQGFRPFLPKLTVTRRHAGRFRTERAAVFPGYIFVQIDTTEGRWRSVNGTIGVRRLVMEANRPLPIRPGVVETLLLSVDSVGELVFQPAFSPGDEVRLLAGPFAGHLGVVQQLDLRGRVELLLTLFGRETRVSAAVEGVSREA